MPTNRLTYEGITALANERPIVASDFATGDEQWALLEFADGEAVGKFEVVAVFTQNNKVTIRASDGTVFTMDADELAIRIEES
jgi:hypothetical protein